MNLNMLLLQHAKQFYQVFYKLIRTLLVLQAKSDSEVMFSLQSY